MAQGQRAFVEEGESARHRTVRRRGRRGKVGIVRRGAGRGSKRRDDIGRAERTQGEDAAARAQRRRHPRGGMTDQQQQRALRRLLQNFEQRIGAGTVQFVDRIDNGDAPAALARRRAEKRHRLADVVDRDLLVQHALVVERALDDEEIGLRLGGDPARHRMFGIDGQRRRRCNIGRRRIGMSEHEARHAIGQRRLADALRAGDQKGVRHAAGAISGQQGGFRGRLAEQHAGRARMRRLVDLVVVGCARAHDAPTSLRRRSP